MKLNILERGNIDIWDMVRKFDAVTFRWALSRSRLAWLVVSEGYVCHTVKKLALFTAFHNSLVRCKKNYVLLPVVCPHWTFYSQHSSVLCHIPTRDVKNSCRMWAVWKKEASKPHSSTWETPYHALHCFSSAWRSRRQKATIPCGRHHTMPCIVLVVHEGAGVKGLQFHVGNTISWFFAQYWKCGTRTWRRKCQKTTILRKVHSYTHCSTIEECSRMEAMKKQVSKGYNSTSHMASLQSEVELQCNLYKKDPTLPTQLSPRHLF